MLQAAELRRQGGRPSMEIAQIDAFTSQPFRGNGATVVLLHGPVTDQCLQRLAAECGQSETAFVLNLQGQWLLRWFTPTLEVDLCGHGTMAAALAMAHWGLLQPGEQLVFHSRSGLLPVQQWGGGFRLQLPTGQLHQAPGDPGLEQLLHTPVQQRWTSSLNYEVALVDPTFPLAALEMDQERLGQRPCLGLVVMQASPSGGAGAGVKPCDYALRFFAPRAGIPEDPVTGSAHALVAPYWLARTGQSLLKARQLSPRGGYLQLFPGDEDQMVLEGEARLVWSGKLVASLESGDQTHWEALLPWGQGTPTLWTTSKESWDGVDARWLRWREETVRTAALEQGVLCPLPTAPLNLPKAAGAEVRQLLQKRPLPISKRPGSANPFLPPDQRLVLRTWGPAHTLLLNKYPIRMGHLLLITQGECPQWGWLNPQDWQAAAALLRLQDGLLFFNSSAAAGASQPHRHLQLLPRISGQPRFPWEQWLSQPDGVYPWRLRRTALDGEGDLATTMDVIYNQHLEALELGSRKHQHQPQGAYNLLITPDWFITIPRRQEEHQGVNINALGFAGMMLVTERTNAGWVAAGGDVLSLLRVVGQPP